jgi:hypothetical protein
MAFGDFSLLIEMFHGLPRAIVGVSARGLSDFL